MPIRFASVDADALSTALSRVERDALLSQNEAETVSNAHHAHGLAGSMTNTGLIMTVATLTGTALGALWNIYSLHDAAPTVMTLAVTFGTLWTERETRLPRSRRVEAAFKKLVQQHRLPRCDAPD
ncbi:MAG: hypothetical protein AB7G06_09630 [Bdellovibrionales bacterium]